MQLGAIAKTNRETLWDVVGLLGEMPVRTVVHIIRNLFPFRPGLGVFVYSAHTSFGRRLLCFTFVPYCGCHKTCICQGMISCDAMSWSRMV